MKTLRQRSRFRQGLQAGCTRSGPHGDVTLSRSSKNRQDTHQKIPMACRDQAISSRPSRQSIPNRIVLVARQWPWLVPRFAQIAQVCAHEDARSESLNCALTDVADSGTLFAGSVPEPAIFLDVMLNRITFPPCENSP